jgi:secernin
LSANPARPSCHWFTGTPDPKHSVFKPFLFWPDFKITESIVSPEISNDPAKAKPRFQREVDRKHLLYKMHENFYNKLTQNNEEGNALRDTLKQLETSCIQEMEQLLNNFDKKDDSLRIQDLFNDCVESELRFYK